MQRSHRHRLVRGVRAANHSSGSVPRRERHGAPPAPEPAPRASPGAAVNTRARLGGTAPRPAFRFPGWLLPWFEGSPAAATEQQHARDTCQLSTSSSQAHTHTHTPAAADRPTRVFPARKFSKSWRSCAWLDRRSPVGVQRADKHQPLLSSLKQRGGDEREKKLRRPDRLACLPLLGCSAAGTKCWNQQR